MRLLRWRRLRRDLRAKLESRAITALVDDDTNVVSGARGREIEIKRLPQASDLDTHDGVLLGVEIGGTIEDPGRDGIGLQSIASTFNFFGDEKTQQLLLPLAGIGEAQRDDALQLGEEARPHLRVGSGPDGSRHLAIRHDRPPLAATAPAAPRPC